MNKFLFLIALVALIFSCSESSVIELDPNKTPTIEPDTSSEDYVDLGLVMDDGRRLYFATRNVGETSPAGFGTNVYRWGATIEGGAAWNPPSGEIWPKGKKLDAAHDIATITWGEKWHTPSKEEWEFLVKKCDYERKEADESGYGVAGYFFYNKKDHSKFIFLPVSTWSNELTYWSSEISDTNNGNICAWTFRSNNGKINWGNSGIESAGFAVRPVFVEQGPVPEPEPEPEYTTEVGHNTEPYFSETVELMGLIFRLAGVEEYNGCNVETIAKSADEYFASMKNHQAVELAKQCRRTGVGYDAVTGYGCQLIFNDQGEIIFDPNYLEGSNPSFDRWTYQQKNDMLVAVNDFYEESNFHDWFESTKSEQEQAIASFKTVANVDYTWFDTYYGKTDKLASRIILSFMTGTGGYGISLKRKDGTLLLTPVIGSFHQENGKVSYGNDVNHVVHELSHPYCNPLIEANWSDISTKANEVYSKVSDLMTTGQAYGTAMSMMYETLVRASVIRYMISHNNQGMANQRLALEESRGFIMLRTLVKALEKREQEADKYPTLADFMPEIIKAINEFDPDKSPTAELDTHPKDYVDLGLVMDDGRRLYFATRNVGETSPAGFGTNVYRWGATIEGGAAWNPPTGEIWPNGKKLDAAHDIATITWGEKWHTPSKEEWEFLAKKCDYERKEADESGYGVAGYFFYNKKDHSKFIFLPVSTWSNELTYWSSEISGTNNGNICAWTFRSNNGKINWGNSGVENTGFAIRPVFVE